MTAIKQIEAGRKIEGFYLIKAVDVKTTNSNNKKYMDFTLGDSTGEINGKLWEVTEADEKNYHDNMLVKVRGTALAWQNSMQLKIEKIRPAVEEDNLDISTFVATAPYAPEEMYETITGFIDGMQNKDIKAIVSLMLEDKKDKVMYYPAAKKNHHAVRSGFLYHISTMLKVAEKLSQVYTFINTDLLYAGVILHDLAKMEEMDASELGIVSDYTVEGQLLGHIIQGVKNLEMAAHKVGADKEVVMVLQHMVLSHHYEPEYGSPVKPLLPEAELLHHIDMIDARMYDMKKASSEIKGGEFSERVWSLDNRKVYRPEFLD
jgi:3'-5' exoribonuclease